MWKQAWRILNLLPATGLPRVLIWYKALFAAALHLLKFARWLVRSPAQARVSIYWDWCKLGSFFYLAADAGTRFLLSADFSVAQTSQSKSQSRSAQPFFSSCKGTLNEEFRWIFLPWRILLVPTSWGKNCHNKGLKNAPNVKRTRSLLQIMLERTDEVIEITSVS